MVIQNNNYQKQTGSYIQKSQDKKIFDGVDELIKQQGQRKLEAEKKKICLRYGCFCPCHQE